MDEIQTRLSETSKTCLEAYGNWVEDKKDSNVKEALQSAIHELRKVSSRLEIELAVSERDHSTSKPLPIPAHRSTNKAPQTPILNDSDNGGQGAKSPIVQKSAPRRRRPAPRKDS